MTKDRSCFNVSVQNPKTNVLTAETTKPHACPKGSYVADATPVEVDKAHDKLIESASMKNAVSKKVKVD